MAADARVRRWLTAAMVAGLLCLCSATWWNALSGEYCYDDVNLIQRRAVIESWGGMRLLVSREYCPAFAELTYRPVGSATFFIDGVVFGKNPSASRALNLLVHMANASLVFLLWRRLVRGRLLAWLAAALFAVHPIVTEAVNCPGFRRDLLALLLMLAALHAWLDGRRGRPGAVHAAGGVVAWFLALLTKESAAMTLPLAGLLAWWRRGRVRASRGALLTGGLGVALAGAAFLVLYRTLSYPQPRPDWPGGGGVLLGFANFARTFALYLRLWVWPRGLSVGHDFDPSTTWADARVWAALALFAVFAGVALLLALRRVPAGLGMVWVCVTLVPVMQFVPTPELVAERYVYISHAGFALALAWLPLAAWRALERRLPPPDGPASARVRASVAPCVAALLVAACVAGTVARNADWSDNVTLNIRRYELWDNARGDVGIGALHLAERNDPAAAEVFLRRAVERDPALAEAHFLLGLARARLGVAAAAEASLDEAVRLNPAEPRYRAAIEMLRRAAGDDATTGSADAAETTASVSR